MALVRVFFSNFPKISLCASVRPHYTEQPAVNFNVLQRGTQNNRINNDSKRSFHQCCTQCNRETDKFTSSSEPVTEDSTDQSNTFSFKAVEELLRSQQMEGFDVSVHKDMPLAGLPNPYSKPRKKCLLCEHKVHVDYKNVRLLSQFVSPYTGDIYGRHITGLCVFMQRYMKKTIIRSRTLGYMSVSMKNPHYLRDPKLFNPFKKAY